MYRQITKGEILYLLDLLKEVRGGVDDGVLSEIEDAEDLLNGILNQKTEEDDLLEDIKKLEDNNNGKS